MAQETKSPYITSEQLSSVADAVKNYIDHEVENATDNCPTAATSVDDIVAKFSVED